MAKTSSIEKNKKRIRLAAHYNEKRLKLKEMARNLTLTLEERIAAVEQLQKLPRNASPVRIRKRCLLTGRPRGYMGMFNLSRIKFRELALQGVLPGVRKASW